MNTASIRAAIVERLGRSDISISLASSETAYLPSGRMTAECRIAVFEVMQSTDTDLGPVLRPVIDETYCAEWPEQGEVLVHLAKGSPTKPGWFTPAEVRAWFSLDARPIVERFKSHERRLVCKKMNPTRSF